MFWTLLQPWSKGILKLVGYVRVSSTDQAQDGLAVQEQSIRRWAKTHGHRVLKGFRDEGISRSLDTRDGLTEALSSIRFNGVGGLLVSSIDRLGEVFDGSGGCSSVGLGSSLARF